MARARLRLSSARAHLVNRAVPVAGLEIGRAIASKAASWPSREFIGTADNGWSVGGDRRCGGSDKDRQTVLSWNGRRGTRYLGDSTHHCRGLCWEIDRLLRLRNQLVPARF